MDKFYRNELKELCNENSKLKEENDKLKKKAVRWGNK